MKHLACFEYDKDFEPGLAVAADPTMGDVVIGSRVCRATGKKEVSAVVAACLTLGGNAVVACLPPRVKKIQFWDATAITSKMHAVLQ